MKKIIPLFVIAVLAASMAFADMKYSLNFRMRARLFSYDEDDAVDILDLDNLDGTGYSSTCDSLTFKIEDDTHGALLEVSPSLKLKDSSKSTSTQQSFLDYAKKYYGWFSVSGFTFGAGLYGQNKADRVKYDAGNLPVFESYGYLGVTKNKVNGLRGTIGVNVDQLTGNGNGDACNAINLGYALEGLLPGTLTLEGAVVNTERTIQIGGDDDKVVSSTFAARMNYRQPDRFELTGDCKCLSKDTWVGALFFSPLCVPHLKMTVGGTFGHDGDDFQLGNDASKKKVTDIGSNTEWAADLRMRYELTDKLSVTTLNNVSKIDGFTSPAVYSVFGAVYKMNEHIAPSVVVSYVDTNMYSNESKYESYLMVAPGFEITVLKNTVLSTQALFKFNYIDTEGMDETTSVDIPLIIRIKM